MLPGHQPGCTAGPATDLDALFDGAGQVAAGTMTEGGCKSLRGHRVPHVRLVLRHVHGKLHELPVRGAWHRASGNGTVPAVYSERLRLAKHAGMKVMELLEKNICIKDIITEAAIHNAMECDMAFGGSTNTVLHLTAIAQEAGHPITMDDWDAASARTPHLVKLQPSGPRPLIDLYAVGGVPGGHARAGRSGLARPWRPHRHGHHGRVP